VTLTGAGATADSLDAPDPEPAPTSYAVRHPRLVRLAGLVAALLGGVVGDLAFPPVGWWACAPVSVAVLTLLVRGSTKRWAFLLGSVYGLALFVPLLTWIRTIGDDAWLLLALTQALELGLLALGLRLVGRLRGWPLWSAAVWVLEEALRGRYPLGGFTWGRWAFSQADAPSLHLAAWLGPAGLSFLVALSGSLVAAGLTGLAGLRGWPGASRRLVLACVPALLAAAALLLAPALVGVPTAGQHAAGPSSFVAAVVQGNVPRLGLELDAQRDAVTGNHVAATEDLARAVAAGRVPKPDIVLWPENATDVDPRTDPKVRAEVTAAVAANGVPMLVGAVLDGPGSHHVSNAGVVWDPVSGPGATYVKRHLVPFGEYIPFRSELGGLVSRFRQIPDDFAPGHGSGLLQVGPVALGDVICYEVAYDGLVRSSVKAGARVLVVQTNNATYGRNETRQQLAMAQVRAVEHGRAVVVASTSGISAFLSPDGSVVASSKIFTQTVLVDRVPLRDSLTLADRLGAGPEWVLALLGAAGCALGWRQARRTRRRSA
jgi:apolipoprotein N-acyltransferase